jgi:hypothetical protein
MNLTGGAIAALAFDSLPLAAAQQGRTPVAYPDPAVEIVDPRFAKYKIQSAAVERLWTGARWAEGPVWFGDGRYLVFSDIPNNRMLRWLEDTGEISVFRSPSNYSNGNCRDRQGRLLTCEHDTRRLTRTEHDGTITVLMDRYQGKPLNAPNDLAVHSDGAIWFTDPGYGIMSNYEGHKASFEVPANVYRLDPNTREATVVAGDLVKPNGICFSPDEKKAARRSSSHSRVRPRKRSAIEEWPHVCQYGARQLRRHSLRCGRERLVRGWMGCGGVQRSARIRARWHTHRQNPSSGNLRESLFRRRQEKPPVYGGQPVALRTVCCHRGGTTALTTQWRVHVRETGVGDSVLWLSSDNFRSESRS